MACFSPLEAWRLPSGGVFFGAEKPNSRPIKLPCGQCIGCRLERSRQWAMRCVHEASLHESNSFVTLTYDDNRQLVTSLNYKHFVAFCKRVRRFVGPFRFFMCGEYGDRTGRPHYHACLFGLDFDDKYPWRVSGSGFQTFRSHVLDALWPHGNSEIGEVSFESAAYCARYVTKKVTGDAAEDHYKRVDMSTGELVSIEPEFCQMSRNPGIGFDWIRLYRSDVYRGDGDAAVTVNGMRVKPPKYYDRYVKDMSSFSYEVECREMNGLKHIEDQSPDRLMVREHVARARLAFKSRNLE